MTSTATLDKLCYYMGRSLYLHHLVAGPRPSGHIFANRLQRWLCYLTCRSANNRIITPLVGSRASATKPFLFTNNQESRKENDREKSSSNDSGNPSGDRGIPKGLLVVLAAITLWEILVVQRRSNTDRENIKLISWNEFYHNMLARGEVARITIRPELNMVVVHLHEGAIIKGRPSYFSVYHLNVPNVDTFEKKLRDAEQSLGIRPEDGVPIVYERISNANILPFLLLLGAVAFFLLRPKSKFQYNAPSMFVSINLC